jgi:hypothetical protein
MAARDQEPKGEPQSREAKLAQALRANLRRRKAGPSAESKAKPHESSSD